MGVGGKRGKEGVSAVGVVHGGDSGVVIGRTQSRVLGSTTRCLPM